MLTVDLITQKAITVETSKILIVDDAPDNIVTLENILEDMPYEIYKAYNGREALSMVYEVEPDLILLDVMMPVMNGFEVAEKLKSDERTRLIPIIMLTALDGQGERLRGYKAGVDDFISKPFNIIELRLRVSNLLKLRTYISELEHAEQIIFSLARTVEAKDKYTEGHCERLSRMSVSMGKKIDLLEKELVMLRRGGLLHDIGKIAIADAILQKKGPLTDEEYEIIKTHTTIGERICSPLKSLKPILPIILYHHEKIDGSGYPAGLKDDEIPLNARIMGLVDCYDALTTSRSYRPAMTREKAMRIIEAETSNGKWDPQLFEHLADLVMTDPNFSHTG
ncbi:MAG TPA: response regulator [Caldithrix abyssi]|uniref:Response regulator n=1 Tax=Caldithrix abyssi TaxID=187145 RepID=A0A7V5RND0_CALAY|nr:response regulator [Caldithrix abyssi]